MSFSQVKDQKIALQLLRGIVRQNRVPSGLLFWGPNGVGKRMTAFEFAKAVNCNDSEDDACDTCLSCRKTINGNHADIMVIKPAGKMRMIKVDVIEEVVETAMFRPVEGGMRLVLIEDAERMNLGAQNHFLKTLEEPPSQTAFVLLTEWPRRLLPTIRSRCQSVRFGTLRFETVVEMMREKGSIAEDQLHAIAALSQGSFTRACDLQKSERRTIALDIVQRLAQGEDPLLLSEEFAVYIQHTSKAIESAVMSEAKQEMAQDPDGEAKLDKDDIAAQVTGLVRGELFEFLVLFDAWYRDELIYDLSKTRQLIYNRDCLNKLKTEIDVEKHAAKIGALVDAWKYIERNLKPARIFRDLFFTLAS
ncbi:MAG: DNA polymerase III subunit delta' [Candidatus Hydrogenedentes bacterium]|nr:DNA polymerase III subunit delta' [Candidatus Hydrogenedentota bacterium]